MKRRKKGDVVNIENVVAWRDRFTIVGREGVWEIPPSPLDIEQSQPARMVRVVQQGTTNTESLPWGTKVVIVEMFNREQ
jgi:hypothetical protein